MTSGKWPQRTKAVKSIPLVGEDMIPSGVLSRNLRESCPFYMRKKQWVSLGRGVCQLSSGPLEENRGVGDSARTTRSSTRRDAFLTPDAEQAVCTASTLRFYFTLFFVWVYSARSVSGSAVLHWYRRYATAKLSVRHPAALEFERSEADEKTWTTFPSTMRIKERTRPPRAGAWSSDQWWQSTLDARTNESNLDAVVVLDGLGMYRQHVWIEICVG